MSPWHQAFMMRKILGTLRTSRSFDKGWILWEGKVVLLFWTTVPNHKVKMHISTFPPPCNAASRREQTPRGHTLQSCPKVVSAADDKTKSGGLDRFPSQPIPFWSVLIWDAFPMRGTKVQHGNE